MFQFTNISLLLFFTAIVNLFTFIASWQRRSSKGGYYFAFGMLASTLWLIVSAFDYAAVPIPQKVFFAKLETVFYNSAIILIFAYFLVYLGYGAWFKRRWFRWGLWVVPITNMLIAITNDWHHLYWVGFSPSPVGENVLIFHHGPAFQWVALTGYSFISAMFIGLFRRLFTTKGREKRQTILLFTALLIPTASNLIYLIEIPSLAGIDWTSIFFSLFGTVLLFAMHSTRFLDILPIARRSIVERMGNPILVFDYAEQLIDFNMAAAKLFQLKKDFLGQEVHSIFHAYPEIVSLAKSSSEAHFPLNITEESGAQRIFDVALNLLKKADGERIAYFFVFHDISEEYRAKELLTDRLKEIELLNQNLNTAQEKLVKQTQRLARLQERERLGRDLHDSVNQSIHSVMLSAETLQALLAKGHVEEASGVAERIHDSGLQALKEIRLLLYEIASPLKGDGANFIELMEERLKMVEWRVGVQAEIEIINRERLNCSQERIENLYWLATEALNNALKHAQAKHVFVRLNCTESFLVVEIEDDGIGFDAEKVKKGGLGMRTMRERAELLGGELSIKSTPKMGTTIRFWTKIEK